MLGEYLAFKKNRALALISPDSDLSMQDRIRADLATPYILNSVGSRLVQGWLEAYEKFSSNWV